MSGPQERVHILPLRTHVVFGRFVDDTGNGFVSEATQEAEAYSEQYYAAGISWRDRVVEDTYMLQVMA